MIEHYGAFVLFVVAMTATPGAGNLAMLALGQRVGYLGAMPFLVGVVCGGVAIDVLVALGLGELYEASPDAALVLKFCGTAYILYLAWKVMRMHAQPADGPLRMRFWEGLILHPLNPKTWAMAVSAFAQFVDPAGPRLEQTVWYVATFLAGMVLFHSMWGLAGAALMRLLRTPSLRLGINTAMVAAMVGATLYALFV